MGVIRWLVVTLMRRGRPIRLTDWVQAIPAEHHCGILTRLYGNEGHSWLCPSCDDEEIEEYAHM